MCVVIQRNPGIELPFDKLQSACTVNPDGWGGIIVDRGKMEVFHDLQEKGNDPDAVARFLEQGKDCDAYLHLRYRTAGSISKEACHPFQFSGDTPGSGHQAWLMHNGTLSDFRRDKSDLPDSYHFANEIVRPLFTRFSAVGGSSEVLEDPLFATVLKKFIGSTSVVLMVDENNKCLIINRQQGKEFDGWWASNEYSFNRTHREKSNKTGVTTYYGNSGMYNSGWDSWEDTDYTSYTSTGGKSKDVVPFVGGKTSNEKESTKKSTATKTVITQGQKRQSFLELSGLSSLTELYKVPLEEMEDFVQEYPTEATYLILDLLKERSTKGGK